MKSVYNNHLQLHDYVKKTSEREKALRDTDNVPQRKHSGYKNLGVHSIEPNLVCQI